MDWFVMIEGEQHGPMSVIVLEWRFAAGEIDGESYVWRDGFDEWLPAFLVEELSAVFAPRPVSGRRPPPPPAAAVARKTRAAAKAAARQGSRPRADITEPEVAAPSPWENPTHVEPLPLGERVHQESIASTLFTDPGAKVKVGTTGSFALDVASWDAAALKAKAAAAHAAAANAQGSQPARPQPVPKVPSSGGAAKPASALRQPQPEAAKPASRALLTLAALVAAVAAGAVYLMLR